jgi:hypothetical protein
MIVTVYIIFIILSVECYRRANYFLSFLYFLISLYLFFTNMVQLHSEGIDFEIIDDILKVFLRGLSY